MLNSSQHAFKAALNQHNCPPIFLEQMSYSKDDGVQNATKVSKDLTAERYRSEKEQTVAQKQASRSQPQACCKCPKQETTQISIWLRSRGQKWGAQPVVDWGGPIQFWCEGSRERSWSWKQSQGSSDRYNDSTTLSRQRPRAEGGAFVCWVRVPELPADETIVLGVIQ